MCQGNTSAYYYYYYYCPTRNTRVRARVFTDSVNKKSTRIISRSVSYRARKKSKTSIEYYNSGELYRTRRRGIPPQSNTIKKYSFAKTSRRVVLNKSVNGFNSFKVRRSSGDEIDSELDDTMTTYLLGRVRQNTSV